jgi:cytoskeletal protein CcmA (bactofilin family)
LTLGRSGVIQGNLDVAYVVLDGAVVGNVRASHRAELAPGARIDGDLYYGALKMAEGAEVNGKLLRIDEVRPAQDEGPDGAGAVSAEGPPVSGNSDSAGASPREDSNT